MNTFSQIINTRFNRFSTFVAKGRLIASVVSLLVMSLSAQAVTYDEAYRQAYQDYLSAINEESGALKRALAELTRLHQANQTIL